MFRSPRYADIPLNQWMALTPPELVRGHLELNDQVMNSLDRVERCVVPA